MSMGDNLTYEDLRGALERINQLEQHLAAAEKVCETAKGLLQRADDGYKFLVTVLRDDLAEWEAQR